MNTKFKGTGVAVVTPFKKDLSIDFDALTRVIEHLITNKVEYLVALGTTGETATLTQAERKQVFEHFAKTVNKRVPLVYGLGGNNTHEILENFKFFDLSKADAVLSVSPYYSKPNQEGIYQHYKKLAENCPLPIIIYNVPGRTSSNITAATTLRLANDFKNIIGTKEASGNMEQCMKIIKNRPKDFLVISGDDNLTLPLMASGADGVISVVANAYPGDFSEMVRQALKGDYQKAKALHYKTFEITEQLFADGSPGGIKAALSILKICEDHVRLPLANVDKVVYKKLEDLIKSY
jgi:4-hydroxy-tetrahydrodipicolinate synthase